MELKLNKTVLQLLAAILAATDSEQGFDYVVTTAPAVKTLAENGLIEINSTMSNDKGENAARITDAGRQYAKTGEAPATSNTATAAAKPSFAIEEVPMVARTRASGAEKYPFEQLEVGQSFFVPNSAVESGDAFKSLSSTVSTANKRHSKATGEFRPNRKNPEKQVEIRIPDRLFIHRRDKKDGVDGARIFRVALPANGGQPDADPAE